MLADRTTLLGVSPRTANGAARSRSPHCQWGCQVTVPTMSVGCQVTVPTIWCNRLTEYGKADFIRTITPVFLPSINSGFTANWTVISSPLVTFPISLTSLWLFSSSYGKYLRRKREDRIINHRRRATNFQVYMQINRKEMKCNMWWRPKC